MKLFDQKLNEFYTALLIEQDPAQPPQGLPQDGGPTAVVPASPEGAPPEQQAAPAEEPKQVSSEGRRFMVDLARRALAVNPDTLTGDEKSIFNDQVTVANAADIEQKLMELVDRVNPAETSPEVTSGGA